MSLSHVHYLAGFVDVKAGHRNAAALHFHAALTAKPDSSSAMTMAALMASAGYHQEALVFSGLARQHLDTESRGVRMGQKVTARDIREFETVVQAEIEAASD